MAKFEIIDGGKGQSLPEGQQEEIMRKRAELEAINAKSVLTMHKLDEKGESENDPLDMSEDVLDKMPSLSGALPVVVFQEVVAAIERKGQTLTVDQRAALNNYIADKEWNMPAKALSFLVPWIDPELKKLNTEIADKKRALLRAHLGPLAKQIDDLANYITITWNDDQTNFRGRRMEAAKEEEKQALRQAGTHGLGFLSSGGKVNTVILADESAPGIASLAEKRQQTVGLATAADFKRAEAEFRDMLTSGDLYSMSYVAINHADPLIRAAAAIEKEAIRTMQQASTKAGVDFTRPFIVNQVNRVWSETTA